MVLYRGLGTVLFPAEEEINWYVHLCRCDRLHEKERDLRRGQSPIVLFFYQCDCILHITWINATTLYSSQHLRHKYLLCRSGCHTSSYDLCPSLHYWDYCTSPWGGTTYNCMGYFISGRSSIVSYSGEEARMKTNILLWRRVLPYGPDYLGMLLHDRSIYSSNFLLLLLLKFLSLLRKLMLLCLRSSCLSFRIFLRQRRQSSSWGHLSHLRGCFFVYDGHCWQRGWFGCRWSFSGVRHLEGKVWRYKA